MIKIRSNVFETNSSSVHSIVITKTPTDPGWFVEFSIGEFGWEFNELSTPEEKASYFYTAACSLLKRDIFNEISEKLFKYGIEIYSTNRAAFEFDAEYTWLENGYIDHVEELESWVNDLMNDTDKLIRFIFNDESFVITGNDNCDDIDSEWMSKKVARADAYQHDLIRKWN